MEQTSALVARGRRDLRRSRPVPPLYLVVPLASTAVVLAVWAAIAIDWLGARPPIGHDWEGYRQGFFRWLETGTPYARFELVGAFHAQYGDFIHPPSFLPLVAPFALLPFPLDGILWVGVPLVLLALLLRRSPWWAYPFAAGLLVHSEMEYTVLNGNSTLWMAAFLGWGLRLDWPAGLIALKPSLGPLVLVGWRQPRRTLAVAAIPVLLTLPLWPDYVIVVANAHLPLSYSLGQWPVLALGALPWLCDRVQPWRAWLAGQVQPAT